MQQRWRWPLADEFDELLAHLGIRNPAYDRSTCRRVMMEELENVNPDLLPEKVAESWRHFITMDRREFDSVYAELLNPLRMDERQVH